MEQATPKPQMVNSPTTNHPAPGPPMWDQMVSKLMFIKDCPQTMMGAVFIPAHIHTKTTTRHTRIHTIGPSHRPPSPLGTIKRQRNGSITKVYGNRQPPTPREIEKQTCSKLAVQITGLKETLSRNESVWNKQHQSLKW